MPKDQMTADLPSTESANGKKKEHVVKLPSAHDFGITVRALETRAEDLKKLASKNRDDGYQREAHAIDADVASIERVILPAFRSQRELPLVTDEQLEREIAAAIRPLIFRAFDGLDDPKVTITPSNINARRDNLVETVVERVQSYATTLADESFNEGVAARSQSAEALAVRCVRELRG